MRVLLLHGYLLQGTGSNVYTASLAAALAAAGHAVDVVCQERAPLALDWVDAAGDWDEGGVLRVRTRREPARVTVYRPDLGGLLPVYVADRYDGIEARPFPELSDSELDAYLAANVDAVREVCARARPDVALAGHLVMAPAVAARALGDLGVPYAVKVHGSALEYTVKPDPERFLPYAREGLAPARAVLTGSRHTAESLWAALGDPSLPGRTRLGPPGVDVAAFGPRDAPAAQAGLDALIARLAATEGSDDGSSFARDPAAAATALAAIDLERDDLVAFVGKLIGSKGVELLVAAWPLVLAQVPAARLVVVGFGALRPELERLVEVLAAGDLAAARAIRAEDGAELGLLAAFLDGLGPAARAAYAEAAAGLSERVTWTGRLDHAELVDLLPAARAMVVPSTFPEAFGMVAAEAAACGTFPVVARHSGLGEVADALAAVVPDEVAGFLSFDLGPEAVPALAGALVGWLTAPEETRARTREAIVGLTRERYSWAGVARTVLAAAQGELDGLPHP